MEGDAASLSPNQVTHLQWTQGGRHRLRDLKAAWKLRALSAWNASGERMFMGKVRISYILYRGRALDEDNITSSLALKASTDALIDHAFPNDDPHYVERGEVQQVIDQQYRQHPKLVMVIEEVEDA